MLKQNFQKNEVVTGKTAFFATDPFCTTHSIYYKGELHSNYIFLYFVLIGLEWNSITLFTTMNFLLLPRLTFQHHLYIYGLLLTNINIF